MWECSTFVFEILHGPLMLLGLLACGKRPEVPTLAGLWVDLPRIETILARPKFPNHDSSPFFLHVAVDAVRAAAVRRTAAKRGTVII
jgi:hypothetical protein